MSAIKAVEQSFEEKINLFRDSKASDVSSGKYTTSHLEKIDHIHIYSPHTAHLDYNAFRSLHTHLLEITLTSQKENETKTARFFDLNPKEFYINRINQLISGWKAVVENQEIYIDY